MKITCPTHPTPSFPPFFPFGSRMKSSSPETVPPTPPCIPTSALSRLSWHGPNLLPSLPHVKFYVSFISLCTNVPGYQRGELLRNYNNTPDSSDGCDFWYLSAVFDNSKELRYDNHVFTTTQVQQSDYSKSRMSLSLSNC